MRNEKLVLKIIEKCMELNNLGQDTFFRLAGHVQAIDVQVCKEKWEDINRRKYVDYDEMIFLNYSLYANAYISDTNKLEKITNELDCLIRLRKEVKEW